MVATARGGRSATRAKLMDINFGGQVRGSYLGMFANYWVMFLKGVCGITWGSGCIFEGGLHRVNGHWGIILGMLVAKKCYYSYDFFERV